MAHRFTGLLTHLVFSTKDRLPFLDVELQAECHAYLGGILDNLRCRRIIIGGASDHVHSLFDLSPSCSLSDVVRTMKSNSSKWIHEKWPARSKFAWQMGYAAFSVSRSAADRVVTYIRGQEEHHRSVSYQDEVRRFLREQRMEPDERYMWE